MRHNILGLLTCLISLCGTAAFACGTNTDCRIGQRSYRIYLPSSGPPQGAIIFAHGYRGTAAGAMRNTGFKKLADEISVAFVAASGVGGNWDIPGRPSNPTSTGANELAYYDALVDDIVSRFDVDPKRIIMTGFSAGGMMVWNLACHKSDSFAGFIPVSGTFWDPVPPTCEGPVANIIHIHGDRDNTVPLEGRPIGPTRQGSVSQALKMYADYGEFGPALTGKLEGLTCKQRMNPAGDILDFCQFSGGHSFRIGHIQAAWNRLKLLGKL